jgi:hypothetical protein
MREGFGEDQSAVSTGLPLVLPPNSNRLSAGR